MTPTPFHKLLFNLRTRSPLRSPLRKAWYRLCGMQIGPKTSIAPIAVNWPHLLRLWDCRIEPGVVFHIVADSAHSPAISIDTGTYIGRNCEFNITKRITIGPRCLIASGCKFVDVDHRVEPIGQPTFELAPAAEINIGENVWLGSNVVVLKGITIGEGAIVGAGAIVTKSIPPYEIWAGVPAKKIGHRPPAPVPASSSAIE